MSWIDAHCHLADPRFERDLAGVLARSKEANVNGWLQGGTHPEDWARQTELRLTYGEGFLLSFGLHPWWAARYTDEEIENACARLERDGASAAAIGELGLDFLPRFKGTEERQKKAFGRQLEIGKRLAKPLVLHVVHAHEEALAMLRAAAPFPRGGLLHAFSGSTELAQRYLGLGFMVSFGGAALRSGKAIADLPAEAFTVETDAPDQLPKFLAGPLNEPRFLPAIAEKIGELRGEPTEKVLAASSRNLRAMLEVFS